MARVAIEHNATKIEDAVALLPEWIMTLVVTALIVKMWLGALLVEARTRRVC